MMWPTMEHVLPCPPIQLEIVLIEKYWFKQGHSLALRMLELVEYRLEQIGGMSD